MLKTLNPWFYGKDYLIISKKGDTVSCFSYLIDHKKILEGGELPKDLRDVYWDSTYSAFTKEVGFNPYLAVRPIAPDSAFRIWGQISKLEPWQINDDQADGDGCPVDSNGKPTKEDLKD
ncbi:hypothetical protein [Parapedobacter koreensis]|uniref:Uncharacterized protein n=1 Tax=Parapedobacter koreensis TaxID=332977 RepID=A0A1H7PZB0_9SPHI|nr:hypothetical protein [Parapedobacter koreensis]SEL40387.1 hypothetical protein SAMN05421740_10561 [Parapedobacter koreensis]